MHLISRNLIYYTVDPHVSGEETAFRILKKIHITYSKYPLSSVRLRKFSLRTIETLIIGGAYEIDRECEGTYPSLSTLELTLRVPSGIAYMSAPKLRHLILRDVDLFCLIHPPPDGENQHCNSKAKNIQVLEMLASRFPTVEILEVHEKLRNLVSEMVFGGGAFFTGLKELRTVSEEEQGWTYD
jgi:hypothetical protein